MLKEKEKKRRTSSLLKQDQILLAQCKWKDTAAREKLFPDIFHYYYIKKEINQEH